MINVCKFKILFFLILLSINSDGQKLIQFKFAQWSAHMYATQITVFQWFNNKYLSDLIEFYKIIISIIILYTKTL